MSRRWSQDKCYAALFTLILFLNSFPSSALTAAESPVWLDFPARELGERGHALVSKLTTTIARHDAAFAAAVATCASGERAVCHFRSWWNALSHLKGLPKASRVSIVNDWVNRLPFVEDRENWRADDYWASPMEFYGRGGDCEDYVIMKYLALRELGFGADDLRIAVVRQRETGGAHAVLLANVADEILVLDNLSSDALPWRAVGRRYTPVYSVNENRSWLHSLTQPQA